MNKTPVKATKVLDEVMEQLPKGAFLTVKYGNRLNTMTIGWGTVGIVWSVPVFTVGVRTSRHTYNLIEAAPDFTVTVPSDSSCRKALAFCGSKSGKAVDKIKECELETLAGEQTATPVLAVPGIHFECRIVLRTPMTPDIMAPALMEYYPSEDYHSLYYGEILASYRTT
ncbi:MAG: flavin reductase family protein [Lentisphaeria bacterium]|nr:flavin reductase family protein [Lentisphaeria bacterium]